MRLVEYEYNSLHVRQSGVATVIQDPDPTEEDPDYRIVQLLLPEGEDFGGSRILDCVERHLVMQELERCPTCGGRC